MSAFLNFFNFRQNPIAYITLGVVAVLAGIDLAEGASLAEIVTTGWVERAVVTAGGIVAYLNVFAPKTVENIEASVAGRAEDHGEAL